LTIKLSYDIIKKMNIEQYTKNKENILVEVGKGKGAMSPYAVSKIIDVPMAYIECWRDLEELEDLRKIDKSLKTGDYDEFDVDRETTIAEIEEYGVSNLSFIFHIRLKMLYFFIMDDGRAFRVKLGELRSRDGGNITLNLLFLFDKLKIKEIELLKKDDKPTSRFSLIDFD
jgi:hypothetical protein